MCIAIPSDTMKHQSPTVSIVWIFLPSASPAELWLHLEPIFLVLEHQHTFVWNQVIATHAAEIFGP